MHAAFASHCRCMRLDTWQVSGQVSNLTNEANAFCRALQPFMAASKVGPPDHAGTPCCVCSSQMCHLSRDQGRGLAQLLLSSYFSTLMDSSIPGHNCFMT